MTYKLQLTDIEDAEIRKAIVAPLVEYNNSKAKPGNSKPLVITIRDADYTVIGGLHGHTSHKWLFTQLLVVPEALRGQGVGTQLLEMAEAEAITRGCIGARLETFEFQARGFYEKMGYVCFGEIQDYPPGFARFFMKKQLIPNT